ncbi:MAG: segregation and condensation protein A [Armatimonadaceae bacterium]|jgi:segregation and condensation protein A
MITDDSSAAHPPAAGGPSLDAREIEAWEAPNPGEAPLASESLVVDVDGFEGPLDLLLALARTQKLDLTRISITALVDQYLAFIDDARRMRLEVAADYLVMAAWLAFLKSRLLLPKEAKPADEMSAEEMAQRLAFRLMRLDAMRNASARLMTRKRLGRDVFLRGSPETVRTLRETNHTAEIYDLLRAYADLRRRTIKVGHVVKARRVWSIKDARIRLERMVGETLGSWLQLDLFIERYLPEVTGPQQSGDGGANAPGGQPQPAGDPRTLIASSFGATLEMTREGLIELQQDAPYAPIHIRRRVAVAAAGGETIEVRDGTA